MNKSMESTDSSTGSQQQPHLPPGFRFHPTDEELVVHYLKKKVATAPLPVSIIAEVDLYKFDPWELPAKATFGEQEWYFFSPRDRKYPNGARPNRAATSGYWKATGTDKPVLSAGGTQKVGVKKALVFYGGKPSKGIKTNWIMHEYRLPDNKQNTRPPGFESAGSKKGSLRLDDWVLCRIYKKTNSPRPVDQEMREDVIGSVGLGQQKLQGIKVSNFAGLLQNNQQNHLLFDGMISSTSNCANDAIINSAQISLLPSKPQLPIGLTPPSSSCILPEKRTFLSSHYWNSGEEVADDNSAPNNNKKFLAETCETNSIATILSQLPQNPPQTMLGSLGYQVAGMNWNA